MQLEVVLGMNFTHSSVSPQWDPRYKERGRLPTDPELFFLRPGGAVQVKVFSIKGCCAVIMSHTLMEWQSKLSRKMIYMQWLDYICLEILLC